jgi:hypothetical protein
VSLLVFVREWSSEQQKNKQTSNKQHNTERERYGSIAKLEARQIKSISGFSAPADRSAGKQHAGQARPSVHLAPFSTSHSLLPVSMSLVVVVNYSHPASFSRFTIAGLSPI